MSSFAQTVTDMWQRVLLESPEPWFDWDHRTTYRERLDRHPRNYRGELIPRIVMVRRNLRRLGKPKQAPRLPE